MRSSTRFYILALVAVLGISAIALLSAGAEGATYDVDLEYQDASNVRISRGLNPSVFNYTVRHTGTAASEEVYIDLEGVPPMWNIFFAADPNSGTTIGTYTPTRPFDFLLTRNETCHLTITVTHAHNQLNRTYWMTVEAYPRLNTTNNDTHRFGVIIGHEPDCHIQLAHPPASGEFLLDTPSITTIRYSLFNTGNGIDRYKVWADFSHFDVGWGITFESGTDEWGVTPNLTADPLIKHPHFIDISIAVPIGARGNETGWLNINVTSVSDPSSPSSEVNATFRTNQTFAFSVSVDRPYRSALPPDLLKFDLTVENTGNGWDYFTLTVDHSYMEGAKFVVDQSHGGIPLDAGESDIIFFTVHVYPGCPPMVLNFTAMVHSSDPSTLPSQDQVAVAVGQIYNLAVRTDHSYLTTEPGDLVEYNIRVKNLGNGEDTAIFDLERVPNSWLWYINPPSLTISSDDTETVNVTIIVPSRFEEAPIGSYHFLITATSENGNVSVPLEIVLEVLQVYRVEWMLLDDALTDPQRPIVPNDTLRPMRSFNPYQSESIDVTLALRNFGNGDDNVSISVESRTPGVDVDVTPEYTFLLRSREQFIRVTISVSTDTPPGIYRIFVRAASEDPDVTVRVVPVEFQVYYFDASLPAVPSYVDPDDGLVTIPRIVIAPGEEMVFEIVVTNIGSRDMPMVVIRGFDVYIEDGVSTRANFYNLTTPPIIAGGSYRIWAGPNGVSADRIAWLSHTSGDHVLEFLLFFDDQSDVTNDRCSVNITVDEPPEITVTTSSLEMKAGENLTVEGTVSDDMSNILWVSFRIDEGEWIRANGTSEWSFIIEDPDLSKGEHTLEVKAYDGISESTIADLTFTVEGKTDDTSTPGPGLPLTMLSILTVGILGTLIRKGRKR